MFEKNLKTSQLQIRISAEEKELIRLMAARSPQGDVTTWLMDLIKAEYKRVIEFDQEVKNFGKED